MRTKIKEICDRSHTKKVFWFLFAPEEQKNSGLMTLFDKIYLPYLSEALVLAAVAIVWYKSVLGNYSSFLNLSYFPLALVLLALLFAQKKDFKIKKSLIWFFGFLLIGLISGILAVLHGLNPVLILLGWVLFAQFGLVILLANLLQNKMMIIKFLVWLSIPMSLMGLYQFFARVKTSALWVSSLERGATRVFGFLGSPNVLGSMLAIIAFLAFGIFLEEKKNLYLLISLINVFVVGLTLSRSAWLGMAIGIAVMIIVFNYKYLLLAPLGLLILLIPQIRKRIAVTFSSNYYLDSTLDGRIWAWINGLHILKLHPLLGSGPGTYGGQLALNYASPVYLQSIQNGYTALYFTDNQFLEILVQTGIIGFLVFLGFIVAQIVELIDNYLKKKSKISLAVLGAFVCFLTASAFANNLEFTAVATPMAIMLGVVND